MLEGPEIVCVTLQSRVTSHLRWLLSQLDHPYDDELTEATE